MLCTFPTEDWILSPGIYSPEREFDNWDPGILSGCVELCIKLDKSSKFAAGK